MHPKRVLYHKRSQTGQEQKTQRENNDQAYEWCDT